MRLYLSGDSKNHIGYTADWIKFDFEEDNKVFTLTLDLIGETDFDVDNLCVRFKGDVIPWALECEADDVSEDLSEYDEDTISERFSTQRIVDIVGKTHLFRIGLYPAYSQCDEEEVFNKAMQDTITDCVGTIMIWHNHELFEQNFQFEYELNVY